MKLTTIIVGDGEIIIKGTKRHVLQISGKDQERIKELRMMLDFPPEMGGSFRPRPNSPLGALSCLDEMYYVPGVGMTIKIIVDGEIEEMPYPCDEPGTQY